MLERRLEVFYALIKHPFARTINMYLDITVLNLTLSNMWNVVAYKLKSHDIKHSKL